MATVDLGRVTPLHRGTYSASATYELNDVVGYQGGTYWHKKETPTTGVAPTNTATWARIVDSIDAETYIGRAETAAASAETKAEAASASAAAASASAEAASDSAEAASGSALAAAGSAESASASAESASAVVAAVEAENRLQGMQIANLKAALYDTVIEDAAHTFAALDTAPIPSHLHDGTEYHKVFSGSELLLDRIIGRTVPYNQLVPIPPSDLSKVENGVHFTDNRDGTVTVWTDADGATANTFISISGNHISVKGGHKYYVGGCPAVTPESGELRCYIGGSGSISAVMSRSTAPDNIVALTGDASGVPVPAWVASGTVMTDPVKFELRLADLTEMYGAGNEPSTAAEFLADFPAFAGYVPYTGGALDSVMLDGIRVNGAAGSAAEPWEFDLTQPQVLNGIDNVADIIEIVESGAGLYNVVKTVRFASVDMGTLSWQTSDASDGFNANVTSYGAKRAGKASAYGYATKYNSPVIADMSDMEIAIGNSIALPILRLRNAAFAGYTAAEVADALSGQMIVFELLTPVTTTLLSGLTEVQVACLTEQGGSITVIGNDNAGLAKPDADVILQIEKAVEE